MTCDLYSDNDLEDRRSERVFDSSPELIGTD